MNYQDKVVIVTGGTRGIGEGCVRVFVEAGAKVVLCSKKPDQASLLVANLNKSGKGEAWYTGCDLTKTAEIENLINQTISKYGQLDCLVNNVGWHPPHQSIDDFSVENFRDLLELNLVSMFSACKFALPHLRKTKGNIINMSSLVGVIGQRHAVTYAATKGAIVSMTKALAIDEAEFEVRVNSVSPGNIYTPLWQEVIEASENPKQALAEGNAAQIMGRMGTIEEVGKLCLFIASEATFTTGVDHIISGGAELGYAAKSRLTQSLSNSG